MQKRTKWVSCYLIFAMAFVLPMELAEPRRNSFGIGINSAGQILILCDANQILT